MELSRVAIILPVIILCITIHEYAHARVALYFGDYTAKANGRVTLNPIKHIDPIGLITLILIGFGWGKPVPVNPLLMKPPRLGEIMVTLAGPASNLVLGIITALILRGVLFFDPVEKNFSNLDIILIEIAVINIAICVFNLIPLFPLDGHHILRECLPASQRIPYQYWQHKYGLWILLFLVFAPQLLHLPGDAKVMDPIRLLFNFSDKAVAFISGTGFTR